MQLEELQLGTLGIDKKRFGRIYSFVDYGNVNYWYTRDVRDPEGQLLPADTKLVVDVAALAKFIDTFSEQKRFYYGFNPRQKSSWHITIKAAQHGFIKVTKPIQFIRHPIPTEDAANLKEGALLYEKGSFFIEIPKSNFDVEISVDAIRLLDRYDTFCLFSGDSDFANLMQYLKKQRKHVIVFAAGKVFHTLKDLADVYVNAQDIKGTIAMQKKTPPHE